VNKTCPKCAADYNGKPALKESRYWCGSSEWDEGDFYQSPECVRRERDRLLERPPNLELLEALELLLCGAEKVQKKGYAFAQLDRGVVMARAVLAKHKEAKP
jgi:hypothetical protein